MSGPLPGSIDAATARLKEDIGSTGLTARQELYCQGVAKGLSGAESALRAGYGAKDRDKAGQVSSRLLRNPKVRARIGVLRQPLNSVVLPSREEHVAALAGLRDRAKDLGQLSAAIRAEELIGKVAGHYVEKVEVKDLAKRAESLGHEAQMRVLREALRRIAEQTGARITDLIPSEPKVIEAKPVMVPAEPAAVPEQGLDAPARRKEEARAR